MAADPIATSGTLYNYATASITPAPVTLGNHHVGDLVAQALSVANTAAAGAFSENLDAGFVAASGFVTPTGAIGELAAGASSTALGVTLATTTAGAIGGAVTLGLVSDGSTIDMLGTTALADQVVAVGGNVYNYATASVSAHGTLSLGSTHVGAFHNTTLTIANTAAAGAYSEALDASFASALGQFVNSGTATDIAAGADSTALSIRIRTVAAGSFSGGVTLALASDGSTIDGLGTTALANDVFTVAGSVYNYATADLPSAVDFGIVHVGDAVSHAVSVANGAASDGFSDALDAAFEAAMGGGVTASGSISALAAGASSSALGLTLDTSAAGAISTKVSVDTVSDGTAEGLGLTDLGVVGVSVTGTVDNYATAALAEASGGGTLTQTGDSYTLDLGTLAPGSGAQSVVIALGNSASAVADALSGTFDVSGDPAFSALGFDALSGIGAGAQSDAGTITLSTDATGMFEETIILHAAGSNASGYSGVLPTETLTVTADVAACYCPGTLIRTAGGDVPVEDLVVGARLVTLDGTIRRVRWIGRRSYQGAFIARNQLMLPVCFKAASLAPGLPCRDLWVSPGHAMFLDGHLVPAWRLINGVSVVQADEVPEVTYFHVELDEHDVIFANGAPAESFLDDDCRGQFQNAATFHALYPDAPPQTPYAPRLEDGFALRNLQRRLAARAGVPAAAGPAGSLRGFVDQATPQVVRGWVQDVTQPEVPVPLTILVGGQPVMSVLANHYRFDLHKARLGSGCHSFAVDLPPGFTGAIEVVRATDGATLDGTWSAIMLIDAEIAA